MDQNVHGLRLRHVHLPQPQAGDSRRVALAGQLESGRRPARERLHLGEGGPRGAQPAAGARAGSMGGPAAVPLPRARRAGARPRARRPRPHGEWSPDRASQSLG